MWPYDIVKATPDRPFRPVRCCFCKNIYAACVSCCFWRRCRRTTSKQARCTSAVSSDRKIGVRVLEEGTTAQPGQYEILGAEVPAGKTYGAIRIEVAKSAELDTQQRELTLCLTDSPDLRVGPDLYLKANVSWHNMLPRPATTKQWSTYNAFIESEASSGSSSTEAYSQAGHQLLLDIFGWEVFPDWGPDYSYYIDAWRARAQAWYDEWKAANPGQKRIHESGSMKGREVTIRTK